MTVDARTIGEELLGAEIVVSRELTEATGNVFDALEKGAAIWEHQARWLVEDWTGFWVSGLTKPLLLDPAPLAELIQRRSDHISAGLHDVEQLIKNEFAPLSKTWTDFLGVIRQDWRST
ncbi:MAG: hypothetical protein P8Y69_12725 [Gammaproteobacteria bacterium]